MGILYGDTTQLAANVLIHHAALYGTRSVEAHNGDYILKSPGLKLDDQVHHALSTQLKYPQSTALAEQVVCLLVFHWQVIQIHLEIVVLLNEFDGAVDSREGVDAENIKLVDANFLQYRHVILRKY